MTARLERSATGSAGRYPVSAARAGEALRPRHSSRASLLVTERQTELVTRQRDDYVRISLTVEAAHDF